MQGVLGRRWGAVLGLWQGPACGSTCHAEGDQRGSLNMLAFFGQIMSE